MIAFLNSNPRNIDMLPRTNTEETDLRTVLQINLGSSWKYLCVVIFQIFSNASKFIAYRELIKVVKWVQNTQFESSISRIFTKCCTRCDNFFKYFKSVIKFISPQEIDVIFSSWIFALRLCDLSDVYCYWWYKLLIW